MMIVETDIAGASEMQDTVPHTHRKAARARPAATGVCRGDRIIGLRHLPSPYFITSCLSRYTTAHFGGESKRGHDPDKAGTGVSRPYGAEEPKSRAPERVGMNSARLYAGRAKEPSEDRPLHWERRM